jgi:hypothetical protein
VQGIGVLRNPENKFCCLGVLADLHAPDGWVAVDGDCFGHANLHYNETKYGYKEGLLSDSAVVVALISMNDTGKSFAEIADFIERSL